MVIGESTGLESKEAGKVPRHCSDFKAKVLEDHRGEETDDTSKKANDYEKTKVLWTRVPPISTSPIMRKYTSMTNRITKQTRDYYNG
jgi:hypothetical protein